MGASTTSYTSANTTAETDWRNTLGQVVCYSSLSVGSAQRPRGRSRRAGCVLDQAIDVARPRQRRQHAKQDRCGRNWRRTPARCRPIIVVSSPKTNASGWPTSRKLPNLPSATTYRSVASFRRYTWLSLRLRIAAPLIGSGGLFGVFTILRQCQLRHHRSPARPPSCHHCRDPR